MAAVRQRDDFPAPVKAELAQRVGHRCSRPGCRAPTSGPSQSSASGASNVGVAAHVTAASLGGPRYDAGLAPADRQSINNGIWLCQNDAKLTDDDVEGLRTEIHEFLSDIGITVAWSAQADLVYMTLYEIAINAVAHGKAASLSIRTAEGLVRLEDDGAAFGLTELRPGGRGGHIAMKQLEHRAAGSLSLRYQRDGARNHWSIVDELLRLGASTPCALAVGGRRETMFSDTRRDLLLLDNCDEVHLYPPALWSVSDWFMLDERISEVLGGRPLIIHGIDQRSSAPDIIKMVFPDARMPD
jgi:hypothetical protein